jgi:hypothetical protein
MLRPRLATLFAPAKGTCAGLGYHVARPANCARDSCNGTIFRGSRCSDCRQIAAAIVPLQLAGEGWVRVALQVAESLESRASTPPAEERVTSFFTRVKKEVTKKEST